MREASGREIAELERRHKKNVEELAGVLSKRTGIHESHLRGKLHEIIESLPMEKRFAMKIHMARIGTPVLAVAILEALTHGGVSTGTLPMEVIALTGIVGGMAGFILSKRYEHKLKELTREHAERVKRQVGRVI